jgi:DNA-binding transcriptional regulator YiaG
MKINPRLRDLQVFAASVGVTYARINRWENRRAKPTTEEPN